MDNIYEINANERPRHRDVEVYCPLSPYQKIEKLRVYFDYSNGPFPLPCNGCENRQGGKTCDECCAAVTLLFFNNPGIVPSEPISPKLPTREA